MKPITLADCNRPDGRLDPRRLRRWVRKVHKSRIVIVWARQTGMRSVYQLYRRTLKRMQMR